MKYIGMPMGMWLLFHRSFRKEMVDILGFSKSAAAETEKKALKKYKEVIDGLPEFEKTDRFKMNIVNCAMLAAYYLNMETKPTVEQMTEYYAKAMMIAPMRAFCRMAGKKKFTKKDIQGMKDTAALKAADRNPYSWNMDFLPYADGSGYEARFSKCGICVLMKDLGIAEIVPAMCHLDYSMSEAGGTSEFVRQYTLASGGPYCDCGYKKIMTSKMTSAQTIMKNKAFIKAEIDSLLPENQSDALWRKATNKLAMLLDRYASLPKGERVHTDSFILPAAAIYLTAKEEIGQPMAYRVIEEAAIKGSESTAKKLAILMRVPGMPGLFVKIWDPMTRKMFGEKSGFKNVFYPKKKGEYRMDIVSCPYFRYFTELGCPELTKIFCANDDRLYGSLPGLKFERTTTLGRGGERCDFYLKRQGNRKRRKHR